MKFGVYFAYWEKTWDADYKKYVRKVADLGFDVLEINAAGLAKMSDDAIAELKEEARKYHVILSGGVGLAKEYDVSSADEEVRLHGVAYMKGILDALAKADISVLGGTIYSYWPCDFSKPVDKPLARSQSIKSMRELADYAAGYGITLLPETLNRFEQFIMNDASEAVQYVKDVGKKNVKAMLDTFHMNIEEDSMGDAIRRVGDLLGHFHIGECNRKVPGKGRMPWDEIGQALRDIHYDGYVVMEPFVRMGGIVGSDIKVWRDLSDQADEQELDDEIRESLRFVKKKFLV